MIAFLTCLSAVWGQSLQDAQQAARQMGYTGQMTLGGVNDGVTRYSGKGLTIEYGGAIPGTRMLKLTRDSELNKDRQPVRSAQEAVDRARAFVATHAEALCIPTLTASTESFVDGCSDPECSGWVVDFYAMENGHKILPNHHLRIDSDGSVCSLMYVPLANEVPREAKLTRDEARDLLLRKEEMTGSFTYQMGELRVVPDRKGGCALVWMLELSPIEPNALGVAGTIDANTGAVVLSAKSGGSMAAPGPSTVPAPIRPQASPQPITAFTLAALAVLLLVFLVLKLRKR